jgi:hypothetical protein
MLRDEAESVHEQLGARVEALAARIVHEAGSIAAPEQLTCR